MEKYEFYPVEVTRFGPVGIAIVTAYTNRMGHPCAESFLLIPGCETIYSDRLSFDVKSIQDYIGEPMEEFMLAEAVQQSKNNLEKYFTQNNIKPPPDSPNFRKSDKNLLSTSWIKGTCPGLREVYDKTELEKLKDEMRPIFDYPTIKRESF